MKIVSSKERFKNRLFTVTEDHAIDPDGFEIKRAIVHHRGSAVMMAVDDRMRILLVRQYRLAARRSLWELPAGSVDPGEKPLQTAKRELKEETGYRAKKWQKLASFLPSPGFLTEVMNIYLATGLTAGDATPMEDERIEARWFSAKELESAIESGVIQDAKTMLGYFFWKRQQRKS
ncbi:MAG TPA: NUDIX hydrolase [Bryobacteraceae bacterium]|nr:NUDIX hydrolase [Bryobacteraceae bacterium]